MITSRDYVNQVKKNIKEISVQELKQKMDKGSSSLVMAVS